MADWSLPSLTSVYADFLSLLKARDNDNATWFDSSLTAGTNLTTKTKRWNDTNSNWEEWNGSWGPLVAKYNIDVETVDGCNVNDAAAASTTVLWTSNKINTLTGSYYTNTQVDNLLTGYVLKNGNSGTLTLGTNDASAVNIETNNASRFSISSTGNTTISAPTSGVALSVTPFAGSNAITATGIISGTQLTSTVATGTSPLTVASTTKVTNLNADALNGLTWSTAATLNTIVTRDASANAINLGAATGTSFNLITGLASVAPVVDSIATVGVSTLAARQDHVHPTNITGAATTIDTENLTASRAMVSDASGKVAVHGTTTAVEVGYLTGVTSAIQTQLDAKAPSASPTLTTPIVTGVKETRVAMGANDVALGSGNVFTKTIAGATTLTVSGVATAGSVNSFILELTNGGSAVITWWTGVKWAAGIAPLLTAAGVDSLGFYTHDGGTTWRGTILARDSK